MDKKLFLIAELDNISQERIKDYYKIILENGIIGNQTKDIPYHITLCSYSIENENNIKILMDELNNKLNKINISFSGFGLFGLNVLFLNPNMNEKIIELYNYFKGNSFDKNNDLAAHVTLLIDEPENILKILPKITGETKAFTGKIETISLYEFFPKRFIHKLDLV